MLPLKRCSSCSVDKPLEAFSKKAARPDGYSGQCKACHTACRGRKTIKQCCQCAQPFRTGTGRKTCSASCEAKNRSAISTMSRNPGWKGGIHVGTRGYTYLRDPGHHRAMKNGYVKRADVVLESKIGRPLKKHEIAHHKDRNKANDAPENLELTTVSDHARLHHPPKPPKEPKKQIPWPSDEELRSRVEASSTRIVARQLGCSHVAVFRRIRKIKISSVS